MRKIHGLTAAGLVGALVLAAPTVAEATTPTSGIPVHSALGLSHAGSSDDTADAISRQDRMFLVKAHQRNLAEIKASQLASRKGRCDTVRQLADVLIKEHSRLDRELRAVAKQLDVRLPTTPSAEQRRQLARVAALSGREFDLAWLRLQNSGHRGALQSIEQELLHGSSPAVKKLARDASPVVKRHLRMIRDAQQRC